MALRGLAVRAVAVLDEGEDMMSCPPFHTSVLTKRQKRMQKIVAAMQLYVRTYTEQQQSYLDYSDETFINDMLYGIGLSLDPKGFYAASGFDKFKAALKRYLPKAIRWGARERK
jgi:hypothetical protein